MKQKGDEVYFITGTDEHGQKVASAAMKENLTEKQFVDKIVVKFKDMWKRLSIDYDYFIRTTDENHINTVQYVLDKLYKKGDLYEGEYTGWYCSPCETFWTKLQVQDGICPECQRPVEEISETNIFFRLSKYQAWLKDYIRSHPDFIKPKFRKNEVLNYLDQPLPDLCITRPRWRLEWGIEVPFSKDHVVYVWFDALLNYISGAGYPFDEKKFKSLWPADIHLMAKDILRPHSIYWPIMLKALDIEQPKMVFAHGWWVLGGQKISKSRGGVVDPLDLIDKYGLDAYRYFLLREIPFGLDGTYSEEAFIGRTNSELANDLGNLLNRTLTMIEKYCSGQIPKPPAEAKEGLGLKDEALALAAKIDKAMNDLNFSASLEAVINLVNSANKFIEDSAPWALYKQKKMDQISNMLYILAEVLRIVSIAIYPVMPQAAGNMWQQLGLEGDLAKIKFSDIKKWGLTKPDIKINKGKPLFPRIATKV
jgi:methionyl-tRNA synthetase